MTGWQSQKCIAAWNLPAAPEPTAARKESREVVYLVGQKYTIQECNSTQDFFRVVQWSLNKVASAQAKGVIEEKGSKELLQFLQHCPLKSQLEPSVNQERRRHQPSKNCLSLTFSFTFHLHFLPPTLINPLPQSDSS